MKIRIFILIYVIIYNVTARRRKLFQIRAITTKKKRKGDYEMIITNDIEMNKNESHITIRII